MGNTVRHIIWTLFLLINSHVLFAQIHSTPTAHLNVGSYDPFFDSLEPLAPHSLFRPYVSSYTENIGSYVGNINDTSRHQFKWFPVVNLMSTSKFNEPWSNSNRLGAGIGGIYSMGEKLYLRGSVAGNHYSRSTSGDFTHILLPNTSFPYPLPHQESRIEFDPRIRASYTPNRFFNFQAGIDHNFIGEGDRSMLQGDYVAPAPFAKIQSSIWKIQFTNLYQFFRERDELGNELPKFASSHMVNFQFTERFQFGLFESVVFMPTDENWTRGFEIDYLNPFLFYRPQAYSIGSQDRLVIGTNLSYNFGSIMLYGQFLLDEFVLSELRARSRWWANKYAGQIGFKGKLKLGNIPVHYRSELNFARPFTYSHINSSTTYGHQGIPLAHPLGANFVESYSELMIHFNERWSVHTSFMLVQQGGQHSSPGISYGNDIYAPYTDRPEDYGFFIGGNGQLNRTRFSLEVQRTLDPNAKIIGFIRPIIESQTGSANQSFMLVFAGIRTNLWNERSLSF